ncbi:MAG: DUF1990 domain-containing protein [Alphaproteobacteria bacterium]|nr:DUF1990 domain-containing protein [Alphaproteobacteria bacterium]
MSAFRLHLDAAPFSYPDVGATRGELPAGWEPDAHTVKLGGPEAFDQAVEALTGWVMFDLPWVRMSPESGQRPGDLVTFASHQLGVWMLHGCRTVYRIDEPDRVGFGYGTLEGHAVAGEEQFLVTRTADATLYSVRKFSRVAHPLARLVPAVARGLQRRFSEESAERMQRACAP